VTENLDTFPLVSVPLASLLAHPENPRADLGDLTDLVASIRAHGIVQALVAVPSNGHAPAQEQGSTDALYLLAGHRRAEAARLAGLTHVPVVIRTDLDERGQVEVMLVENVQRADLAPVEQAKALSRLVDLGLSQRDIAARTGIAQGTVSKRLALLALPVSVAKAVDSGGIAVRDAEALAKVAGDAVVLEAAHKFVKQGRKGDEAVKAAQAEKAASEKRAANVAKAEALGAVPVPQGKDYYNQPKVEATQKAVKACAGHPVWYVAHLSGDLSLYCSAPRKHPRPKSEQDRAEAERAAKLAWTQAKVAGQTARLDLSRTWVKKADAKKCADLALWFVPIATGMSYAISLYNEPRMDGQVYADDLLGLEYGEDATVLTRTGGREKLRTGKPVEQARLAAAAILSSLEADLASRLGQGSGLLLGEAAQHYIDLIGYTLSEAEAARLAKVREVSIEDKAESVVRRAEDAMAAEDEAASGVDDALAGVVSDGDAGL
jgi:ParB/RepB/Spo0J family partition protein